MILQLAVLFAQDPAALTHQLHPGSEVLFSGRRAEQCSLRKSLEPTLGLFSQCLYWQHGTPILGQLASGRHRPKIIWKHLSCGQPEHQGVGASAESGPVMTPGQHLLNASLFRGAGALCEDPMGLDLLWLHREDEPLVAAADVSPYCLCRCPVYLLPDCWWQLSVEEF